MPKTAHKPQKKAPKPPKYITESIKIEKLAPGGQSLGTLSSGEKIFLWDALPGETVTKARIMRAKSSYVSAIAEEITDPSPYRIEPKDACYLSTSPWQIFDYNYELEQKAELLKECFRQQKVPLNFDIPSFQTDGQDLHYRNKMEYALFYSHDDSQIHLAFRGRGTHLKILVDHSNLERPEIWDRALEIVAELNHRHADARNYQSLLLRCSQNGQVSGGLLENHHPHPIFPNLTDSLLGHTYSYSPNGFFQINLPVYELALQEISRHIKTQKVLDLYAGVGTIGLSVARDRDLTLVEVDHSAYHELEHNTKNTTAHPVCAKSEEALEYIAPDQTVILDPPRAGCNPKLIEKLLDVTPETIIYLSCNPITQARDAKMLLEKYRLVSLTPYNFFPRTPHLENLIVLERK